MAVQCGTMDLEDCHHTLFHHLGFACTPDEQGSTFN